MVQHEVNRNYVINGLIGKEWMLGRNKQNILSINLKLTLQGGDRYSPIDMEATMKHRTRKCSTTKGRHSPNSIRPCLSAIIPSAIASTRKKYLTICCEGLELYGHERALRT